MKQRQRPNQKVPHNHVCYKDMVIALKKNPQAKSFGWACYHLRIGGYPAVPFVCFIDTHGDQKIRKQQRPIDEAHHAEQRNTDNNAYDGDDWVDVADSFSDNQPQYVVDIDYYDKAVNQETNSRPVFALCKCVNGCRHENKRWTEQRHE